MRTAFYAALAACAATPAFAQDQQATAAPEQAIEATAILATAKPAATAALPANTEVMLRLNDELSSKAVREGAMFKLTLTHDVMLDNHVVIPRGTPAMGEVTWRTGKGAFGKSAKMEVEMRYLDLNGRRIPISGKYRQEGEGNTAATIGGVIAAGVFAAFITGKSAVFPQGREFKATTSEALAVAFPNMPTTPAALPAIEPAPAAPMATVTPAVATN